MSHNEIPLLPGVCYHIFNHANGFENLFVNEGNYLFFLKKYVGHISPIAETLAYCLMPNHFHLMVRIKSLTELASLPQLSESFKLSESLNSESLNSESSKLSNQLSKQFGNLFSAYAQAFNKQQNRKGSLFISNFKRKEVSDDRYFARLVHYIHYNAVQHGFVEHPSEWPHSSFMSLLSEKPTKLQREEVLDFFGGRDAFLQAHNLSSDDKMVKLFSKWF